VVLTDDVVRRLVRAASAIKRVFGNRDQDIEWAYMKGQIYIVQSRPFVRGT
jgi:phosphoenolpyruvate synthase/pyruvate phosphate dikinase